MSNKLDVAFLNYCNSESLNKEQDITLEALKDRYKINSCDQLFEKLDALEFINLRGKKISDVSIFKYFSNLKRLALDKNKIDDLVEFEALDSITYLSLRDNNIKDVRPLLKMKSLEQVYLDKNPIIKESEFCPINSQHSKINEFCFDLDRFNKEFKYKKNSTRLETKDIREIIKNVIDYPGMQIYYHVDAAPNRSPLQVYFNFDTATDKLDLEKFNEKVIAVKKPNKLSLKIKIEVHDDLALVKFIYPPEGIRGNFRMGKSDKNWAILKSFIYE